MMSLKDSLESARERAERARYEAEREAAATQASREAMEMRVDRALEEAAEAVYRTICDRIAEEIYADGGEPRPRAAGYVELPDSLRVSAAGARARRRRTAGADGDAEPEPDEAACEVRLTEIRREEIFWGYRKHLLLTQHGAALVEAVRRRAADDGVSIDAAVMEEAPGSDRRFIEISRAEGTVRCTGNDSITCRLVLRYGYAREASPRGDS